MNLPALLYSFTLTAEILFFLDLINICRVRVQFDEHSVTKSAIDHTFFLVV